MRHIIKIIQGKIMVKSTRAGKRLKSCYNLSTGWIYVALVILTEKNGDRRMMSKTCCKLTTDDEDNEDDDHIFRRGVLI